MNKVFLHIFLFLLFTSYMNGFAQKHGSPDDSLPNYIKRITQFGERPDWSHDGKKILFLEKTYGDVYELEIATGKISLITGHFYHGGFLRALYLANDDVLLSGCMTFDANNPHINRSEKPELWVLDKSYTKPPVRLGVKCFEGPAVSRKNMKISWTVMYKQNPDSMQKKQCNIYIADIVYNNGIPSLVNKKLLINNKNTPYFDDIETQSFVPPLEKQLTFSAYVYQGTEAILYNIETGEFKNLTNAPKEYDEPEGVFPDGKYTCLESDKQSLTGWRHVDLWKLKLDGSGEMQRLTYFSDYKDYTASNPVISDDGKFMSFQKGYSGEEPGAGHGIYIMDFSKVH